MDSLLPLRSFVRVVETGSFSAVAAELRTTQPTISRQIASLEADLGCRLFNRTTRSVTLTDDGRAFYARALQVLDVVAEAEMAVGRRRAAPSGTLRLAVPVAFGRLQVVPRLPAFLARYPACRIDLVMNDRMVDLVEEGIDLAIRVGEIADPQLIARRVGTTRRICLATRGYLAARGTPVHPSDLAAHDCVLFTASATGTTWRFANADGVVDVEVGGRFQANNSEAVREAVLAGLGIGVTPVWLFAGAPAADQLVTVLPAWEPPQLPIHAIYPSRRHVAPKVRAMIDYIADEFLLDPRVSPYGVPTGGSVGV